MAWKHGLKPAEKLWLRRKEMEMENQLEANWRGRTLVVFAGARYRHRLVLHSILDRVHRQRGIKRIIINDYPHVGDFAREWARPDGPDFRVRKGGVAGDAGEPGNNVFGN